MVLRGALRLLGLGALFVVVLVAEVGGVVGNLLEVRRILAIEERGGLLEREALGLDDKEVKVRGLEREPAAVHDLFCARAESASGQGKGDKVSERDTYVVLPADVLERNRVDVLVENEGDRDGQVEDVEALRTERVREDLKRVRDNERREGKAIKFMSAKRSHKRGTYAYS